MTIDVDTLLDQAFNAFNQKEFEKAEALARQAQLLMPAHGDVLYLLGLIALNKNILTQACDYLTTAVRLYPEKSVYQMTLADIFVQLKNFESAEKIYNSLPLSDDIKLKRAWLEKERSNIKKALALFNQLKKTPKRGEALYGLSFFQKGLRKEKNLKESFKLNPCEKTAVQIVEFLIDKKYFDQIKDYIFYISDKFLLAKIDSVLNQKSSAKMKLEALLKKQPYHLKAWILLGQLQEENPPKAEYSFSQALALDKNNYEAHKSYARLLMKQARFSEALNHYQILCRMNPEDTEVLLAMALMAENTKNYSESLGLYFRLLTLGVKNLSITIKNNIKKLSLTDKKQAEIFLKGWQKSYPKNKIAQKMKLLGLIFLFFLPQPCISQSFQEDQNLQLLWEGKMADNGDLYSQFYLGELFEQGKEVPKDLIKAVQYYEKSAFQGYVPAALKLGDIFSDKKNELLYNEEKSQKWFQFAAEKGDIQAQYYLAEFYQENDHLDLSKAKKYLEKALKKTFPYETNFSKVSPQYASLLEKMNQKNDTLTERKNK